VTRLRDLCVDDARHICRAWLSRGWSVVVGWMGKWSWINLVEVEYWLEGRMNGGQDKDGWSADE